MAALARGSCWPGMCHHGLRGAEGAGHSSPARIPSHFHVCLALQMGNASNTSVFTSTLSEREDLIFGTVYLVFGKERWPLDPHVPAQLPARVSQAFSVTGASRSVQS